MQHFRKEHMIYTINGDDMHALSFPSVNQAKRYNRTKLGGKATIVAKAPKVKGVVTQGNDICVKEA